MARTPKKARKNAPKKAPPKKEKKSHAYVEQLKAEIGRPRALVQNALLLTQIKQLAAMRCTKEEAAAFLGVSKPTFNKFLSENRESAEAWESGPHIGKVSLRQMQWTTAKKGNVRMQIWLGIQMLGQANRVDARHSGADGGPIQAMTTDMTPAQAAEAWQKAMQDGPG